MEPDIRKKICNMIMRNGSKLAPCDSRALQIILAILSNGAKHEAIVTVKK
jgi:hypothetical protein